MPANKPYLGENPAVAKKRIAANKAKRTNPSAAKAKSNMTQEGGYLPWNVDDIIRNMGY